MTGYPSRIAVRRGGQVVLGTITMGIGIAVLLAAGVGLLPLDILHSAVARLGGWSIGGAIIAVQSVLLVFYVPLGVRPGPGTVAAAVLPALTCDVVTGLLPVAGPVAPRLGMLVLGGTLFAFGTAAYLGAGLGSMPRDGLMLALHQRRGYRLSTIRVTADLCCLVLGLAILGPAAAVDTGVFGVGSLLLALLVGPTISRVLPFFSRIGHDSSVPTLTPPNETTT